ncbi:MAG: competence/damage-inducible protein A [Salibacteraceae bacterium]
MNVEIITIGDELLIGQITDTNSAWMGKILHDHGYSVVQISSISDEETHIKNALKEAEQRADIILITGGLGPTKDDITKITLANYFGDEMIFHKNVYDHVKSLFDIRNIPMPEINSQQANLPSRCISLKNAKGTAPGMWFNENGKVYVSMPGVPYEMKYLMQNEVIPKLNKKFSRQEFIYKTVLTQGIGESSLMELIGNWESDLLSNNLKLAWLPSAGQVRLRISTKGADRLALESHIDSYVTKLKTIIPDYYVGDDSEAIELIIGNMLRDKKWTVGTAESCTGGYLAHLLSQHSGSSDFFEGSVVSYSNRVKESVLGVSWHSLKEFGAVSKQVVEEMAVGAKRHLGTDCAISTSGIAGPTGGSKDKPVGTIWIAVATPNGVFSEKFRFGTDRQKNIIRASQSALRMLQKEMLKYS